MTSADRPGSASTEGSRDPSPTSSEEVRFFHEDFPSKETLLEVLGQLDQNRRSAHGDLSESGGTVNHYRQLLEAGLAEGLHLRDISLPFDFAEMGRLLKRIVLNDEIDRPDLKRLVLLFGRSVVIVAAEQPESQEIAFQLVTSDRLHPAVEVTVSGETLFGLLEDGHWEFAKQPAVPPAFPTTQHP